MSLFYVKYWVFYLFGPKTIIKIKPSEKLTVESTLWWNIFFCKASLAKKIESGLFNLQQHIVCYKLKHVFFVI